MAEALAFPPDRIRSAILLRVLAAGLATGIGICVHGASKAGATTGQVVTLRAALSIPVLLLWAVVAGPVADMLPRRARAHLLRGLLGGCVMILNFYALGQLPVVHAQTIAYLAPVLAVPAAVILLGERLSVRAVVAVSLGCAGMFAMLYTTAANPDWGAAELSGMIAGLLSAALMAVLRVVIRRMTLTETTASIALSFAVIATGVGLGAVAVTGWTPMTAELWGWLCGAGLFGAMTHIAATEAARRAPIGVLAAYDYTGLIFAVVLDFVLFANLPGPWGWLGIALILGAGGLAAWTPRPEGTYLRLK